MTQSKTRSVFRPCPGEEDLPVPLTVEILETRLIQAESLAMHLQRDFETLNSVVLEQQKVIERLQLALSRVDDRLARLGAEDETRDLQAERPPHY